MVMVYHIIPMFRRFHTVNSVDLYKFETNS